MVDYCLADDEEERAARLLAKIAPPGAHDGVIRSALGLRYRGMAEALRDRRMAQILRKPVDELLPKLQRWAARAIQLNRDDYLAHYLAADLAFHADDCDGAARHLVSAIETGLPIESAEKFLQAARGKRPDCKALTEVWTILTGEPQTGTAEHEHKHGESSAVAQ